MYSFGVRRKADLCAISQKSKHHYQGTETRQSGSHSTRSEPTRQKGQVWRPPCFLQPPIPQPGPEGLTNKTGWKQSAHCSLPGWNRSCIQLFPVMDEPPGERPSHTPQKITCKQRSANSPAAHLQGTPHSPHPNISGTDSNDQLGPHTRRNSSSDKVTSRGVLSSPARVLQEWTTGPGTELRGPS